MNRVLYQLSYAAILVKNLGAAEISLIIIYDSFPFVKKNIQVFGNTVPEVIFLIAFRKRPILFCLGGGLYTALELLWRGRSHISMFALGGGCFLALGRLDRHRLPPAVRAVTGAGLVTAGELLTGLLVNRDHRVWDYRRLPLNFRGQICLPYSMLWMPVSLLAMEIYRRAEGSLPS